MSMKAKKKFPQPKGQPHARAHAQSDYEAMELASEIKQSPQRMKGVKAYAKAMENTTAMGRISPKKKAAPKKKTVKRRAVTKKAARRAPRRRG